MKVMFAYGGFENLGIEYLSSVLKKHGHSTRLAMDPMLFDDPYMNIGILGKLFDYRDALIKQISDYKPGILAFSVVSCYYKWALEIAGKIKAQYPQIHITFGGIHPSSVPERVLINDCVDSVILGEGEYPLLELANSLERKSQDYSIRNIWFKKDNKIVKNNVRPYIEDLDSLPFPDKELFYQILPKYRSGYTVMTKRGCANNCSFCCSNIWHMLYPGQKRLRCRSVENTIKELKEALDKYNFRQVRINDEIFTNDREWLKDFSKEYKKHINKPLCCFASADFIDVDVISYLKDMNCYQVCMGVQTINQTLRRNILKREADNEQIKFAISIIKKNKIRCVVDNIFGLPGEKEEDILELAKFYNENKPDRICVFWLIYFPKTPINHEAMNYNILNEYEISSMEENPYNKAITLRNKLHNKNKIKYHWLMLAIMFLPKTICNLIINLKLYKLFPSFAPSILESLYTMLAKDRLDIPRKRYYIRYLVFIRKIIEFRIAKLLNA